MYIDIPNILILFLYFGLVYIKCEKLQQGLMSVFSVVTETRPQNHRELVMWNKGNKLNCNSNSLLFLNLYPTTPSNLPLCEGQNSNSHKWENRKRKEI